ncbi:MAG TPA: YqiA/YcfP family alpha/beta fold hydrolase [Enhygromyxa sp.]|nr:YqiA/YcfP family alpha/beta fold hydrolase [Enhygromyxa sp.]
MSIRHAYLHGFASSSMATKGQALKRFYAARGLEFHTPDLNAPSFAELSYSAMLERFDALDRELDERDGVEPGSTRWRLIGSSMGGFVAARWAQLHPERVDRLLLLCPAFDFVERWPSLIGAQNFERWREQGRLALPDASGKAVEVHFGLVEDAMTHPARPEVPRPTTIIHGTRDTVVPIESSREYAQAHRDRVRLVEVDDDHLLARSLATIEAIAEAELIARKPKLYWDYFGPTAEGTAEHFRVHLDEFLQRERLEGCETGVEVVTPGHHAAAWCRCPEPLVDTLGRALRPRRLDR